MGVVNDIVRNILKIKRQSVLLNQLTVYLSPFQFREFCITFIIHLFIISIFFNYLCYFTLEDTLIDKPFFCVTNDK